MFTILYACLNAKSVRLDYSAGNNSLLSWRETLSCLSDILNVDSLNAKSVRLDYSAGNNSLLSWRETLSCLSDILLQ